MSRFLFVVPPLVGHINPAVGVTAELASRGHESAWACADPGLVRRLAGEDATVFPCAGPVPGSGDGVRPPDMRGPEALKFLWERFLAPLAEEMAAGVAAAIGEFGPDVVVADQQALAGGLVAERLGLPWATSATTSAEFTDVLSGMPKVAEWLDELLAGLRSRVGDPAGTADPRFSPHLVLAFSTPEFVGPDARTGDQIRYVGPSVADRPAPPGFPWDWLDPARATVLVTLGTANTDVGARFLTECHSAARERADRMQTVIVDPAGVLGSTLGGEDEKGVLIVPSVPQLPLLERVDAVVCHAGHNTVCETLWHGVPLVVAPIRDDQPVVAGQVVAAGAGIRVRFGRVTAPKLGAAIEAVLHEPGYRFAAGRIRAAFRAAGGASAAATHLEQLAIGAPAKETV
ncbi:glycosyltransferase [Streptomyces sp. NBC_00576]|uniref:glycosyltransferase n=1 Tax=Streptomyces sp. NBC_00576 TaxID=2903665 RepID=UPI002E8115C3|nr:glycosyltransferase [Streptomyces sp. NBC_00576]WUB71079.1 glycosyltransferase [Streptomyces sp. NBC_00576]